MSDLQELLVDGVPCGDPECDGWAEPEVDGVHQYYCCEVCGFEFGYEQVGPPPDGSCAIGVPEDIRRAASAAMDVLNPEVDATPIQLGPTRR